MLLQMEARIIITVVVEKEGSRIRVKTRTRTKQDRRSSSSKTTILEGEEIVEVEEAHVAKAYYEGRDQREKLKMRKLSQVHY